MFLSIVLVEMEVFVSVVANVADAMSAHSYVGQHSPPRGVTSMQPPSGAGGHSLKAQDNSSSKHWHI